MFVSVHVKRRYKEDDEVVLVTFDSITERVYVRNNENPRISDLRKMSIKCRGCTSMSGVIEELRKALGKLCFFFRLLFNSGFEQTSHLLITSSWLAMVKLAIRHRLAIWL